jgi:hypothetical protein
MFTKDNSAAIQERVDLVLKKSRSGWRTYKLPSQISEDAKE